MGLMIGNYYDLPIAQTVVALMSLMLLLSWFFRWIRESRHTVLIEKRATLVGYYDGARRHENQQPRTTSDPWKHDHCFGFGSKETSGEAVLWLWIASTGRDDGD